MKKRILSILLALCMLFCLVPTTAFAADCAEDLVDPVIWIHLSSDGGGYYDVLNGTWTAADFFQPGKAPKGAKITAVMPPTSPSIPVSVNVNSDGTLNCTKTENTTEPVPKSETYTVTITSDDYAPISAPLTVRQYLNAGFRGPVYFDDELLYGDTYTYTCRVNNPGENGVWSALIQDPQMFEIYKETTDTTSEPGKSIYTVHIRAIKAGARVTCIDFLYVSDTTMASSKVSRGAVTGGAVRTRPLTVTAGSATITEGNALPTDLVTCTGLLNSEGRKDDRDTVLDNALGYQLLDANNEEVTAATARNMPGTYTVVPAATLKSGWGERYSLNKVNGTLTVENQPDEQFTLAPGGRYYFDLSTMNIPGTVNSDLPDSTLHYVPFTYVGTVNAYKLTSETATTNEYAQQNKYAHSLFVADYAVTLKVNWNNLDTASLIFGKNYASGGVDYTLRAPSVGSNATGLGDSDPGEPQSNEWDTMLNKDSGYIQNWNEMFSWGQDTVSFDASRRAVRGYNSARHWLHSYATRSYSNHGFRPVLEVRNPNTLGPDGLKAVTLALGGGKLGGSSDAIHIIVKTGSEFTAPASDGLNRPDGNTGSYFMWLDVNGNSYAPGASVPADVTALTVQWTAPAYTVTLNAGNGTINNGNVTSYTYGVGATLPTDVTRTGYTFKGWYDNENLTGSPVTAISNIETGNKEYWAKWEANAYTVTLNTNGGTINSGNVTEYTYGVGATLPTAGDMTYTGHTFVGWYDNENLTGSPVTAIGSTETGNKEYWAKWEANTYTVTFYPNGGSVNPVAATTDSSGKLSSLPTPTRGGNYRFDGWYTKQTGGIKVTLNQVYTADTTLYAYWIYTSDSSSSEDRDDPSGNAFITDRPNKDNPTTQTTAKPNSVKVDSKGNAVITRSIVADVISVAQSDSIKHGNTKNGIAVVVPVEISKALAGVQITLKADALDKLVSSGVKRFIIDTDSMADFGFMLDTLKELNRQTTGDLILKMKKTAVTSQEVETAIGNRPVYDITLWEVKNGVETAVNLSGKTVSIAIPYTPAKNEQPGNLYAVYVDENGNVQWISKSSYNMDQKAVIFVAEHFSIYGIGYKNQIPAFTDVNNHWAKDNMLFVVSRGLLSGTSATTFSPNTGMTRGMFVTALGRLAGVNPTDYQASMFTDVKEDAYYAPYVNWAAKTGVVSGTTDTTFAPDTNINREQMAVIMKNYATKLGYTIPKTLEVVNFADSAGISSWAKEAVKSMQQAGILAGKTNNCFDPAGTATKAEVATVLRRFVEIVIDPQTANGWVQNDSGEWSYYKNGDLVKGWLSNDQKWYWLDKNTGKMFSGGWKQIDGKQYYFYADGSMAVNTTVDGKTIGADGARK